MPNMIEMPHEPSTGTRDVLEAAIVGTAGAVPVVGSFLSAAIERVLNQQADNRGRVWLAEVVDVLNALAEKVDGLDPENLLAQPEFYDSVLRASRIASASSSQEKHRSLQNALFNTASAAANIDDDTRSVFLRYVEELTPSHIRILRFFKDPTALLGQEAAQRIRNAMTGSVTAVLREALPELGRAGFTQLLAEDLTGRSLLGVIPFNSMMTGDGPLQPRITGFGEQFLEFLSGPFGEAGVTVNDNPTDKPGAVT